MRGAEVGTMERATESPAKAWMRALERTAGIAKSPARTFPSVIEEQAATTPNALALTSDRECLTYRQLAQRINQYSRWALDQGLKNGDVVGLLMRNQPEYIAAWLGITRVGAIAALLNTNQSGATLAHSIRIAGVTQLIADPDLVPSADRPNTWTARECVEHFGCEPVQLAGGPSIEDTALLVFTSGTTGLPKAARISHGRIMQWGHWFAGMMDARPSDRMYNCLPMYHSVGGVQTPCAMLAAGGSVVLREKFSATQFWSDIRRWDCTLVQYIGELCRYLLRTAPSVDERRHGVRLACGNGLPGDIWEQFRGRFGIPRILEFYAATEGGVSLFNLEGKPGSIGRVPRYLEHRFSPVLIKTDVESGEPIRDASGFCVKCAPGEAGEAIAREAGSGPHGGSRFEGYTDAQASDKKILRGVFTANDVWVRTGDLMRKDEAGFFYFADRLGDTFRWKGENVSTTEVEQILAACGGVRQANVYGVAVPFTDGKAGMVTLVVDEDFDLAGFQNYTVRALPAYSRPAFLRLQSDLEITGTFKQTKAQLVRDSFDPRISTGPLYFLDQMEGAYVPLDQEFYDRIRSGEIQL